MKIIALMLDELVGNPLFQLTTSVFGLFGLTIPSIYKLLRGGIKLTSDEKNVGTHPVDDNKWMVLTPRSLYHEWHINYLICKSWSKKMVYLLFPAVPLMVLATIIHPFALEAIIIFVSFSIVIFHVFMFLFKITKQTDWLLSKFILGFSVIFSAGILFIILAVPYWLKVSLFPTIVIYTDLMLWKMLAFPRIKNRPMK